MMQNNEVKAIFPFCFLAQGGSKHLDRKLHFNFIELKTKPISKKCD